MMFSFIAKHRGIWPVALICEALGVSRSGFYGSGERLAARLPANILNRQFDALVPNRKSLADFTYVWTSEG